MRKLLTILVLFTLGCGAAATPRPASPPEGPVVAESRRPEVRPLPPDPSEESLPRGTPPRPPESYVEAMEAEQCVTREGVLVSDGPCPPESGLLISEARAVRDAMYRVRYPQLRQYYVSDRQVWVAQREMYESQIQLQREEIERLQPSWWEENDGTILAAAGVVVGVAVTVLVTFAVNQAGD